MKFELHCHTCYSKGTKLPWEGINSPEEIFREAKRKGLHGVAVTDHNTIKAWKKSKEAEKKHGILFIPGIEINTKQGHLIGLGLNEFIPKGLNLDETIEKIHEQGGICVAPHPFDIKNEGIGMDFVKCDAAEVFNSLNLDRFSNVLAKRKVKKYGIPMVCGSDAHTKEMVGSCINFINAQTVDEVLKEIKKSNVRMASGYISLNVIKKWAYQRLSFSYKDAVNYIEKNYNPVKKWVSKRLLDKFVSQPNRAVWTGLGYFGLFCSYIYSATRTVLKIL